jgi:GDP-L-fucose synthase
LNGNDLAESCIEIMKHHDIDIINIGTSEDLTIKELAEIISSISNFKNNIVFDNSMPNGTMRKLLDVSLMKSLGLKNKTSLIEGIKKIYYEYK